ncbi:phosphatase PAP2 family protein [Maribacter sp. 2307ULW6-5]|uniref:phosphatase PAP2 family protein n=1 Tax=Maribacter sp. 2307ULW6-5 TaxID=3386275 RepID=UPI0039BD85FA
MLSRLLEWDRELFVYLNGLGIESFDVFWATVTLIPTWIPLFLFFIYLFLKKYPKKEALYIIGTILVLALFVHTVTDLTKEIVGRLRPNNDPSINRTIRILRAAGGFSFFSGHASLSFAVATAVYLFLRSKIAWGAVFFVWPLLFASSRLFVGVHFPLDILVGALVGIVSAFLFRYLYGALISPGSG